MAKPKFHKEKCPSWCVCKPAILWPRKLTKKEMGI